MRTRWVSPLVAALTLAAGSAHAADERLLVVVESTPGAGIDAREVRQTIGAELGIPVVAPEDATAAEASNVLIVSIDKSDIRMSLRGSAAGLVGRTIPAPGDRPTRLREIAWLAGNLARDQVSGIVAVPPANAAPPKELAIAASGVPPPTAPLSAAPSSDLPPPTSDRPLDGDRASSVLARPAGAEVAASGRWTITAAGGPTATYNQVGGGTAVIRDTSYQLEVQHQASPDALIFGGALEVGTNATSNGAELMGIAGLVGSSWHRRRWFLETTAGVGLELARLEQTSTRTVSDSSSGTSLTTTVATGSQPVLFARGIGSVGFPIARSLDLVGRVGIHLASSGGFATDFLSATAGLRFSLP